MTVFRRTVSRRDAAIVAAALLVPIPVLAQTGLSLPLLGGLDGGFGSIITLDGDDGTGMRTSGQADVRSGSGPPSGASSVSVTPSLDPLATFRTQLPIHDLSDGGPASGQTAGADGIGSGEASAGPEPGDAGGGGDEAGSPGASGPEPGAPDTDAGTPGGGASESSAPGSSTGSPLTITAEAEGSSASASVGDGDVDLDLSVDDDAASGDESDVGASVTQPDGSSTGTGTALPGLGGLIP